MKLVVAVSLATVLAVASGKSAEWTEPARIIGGSITTISQYPYSVAMLHNFGSGSNYRQACGGTILNQRHILTAAHCFVANNGAVHNAGWWRGRVGSTSANSGGVVHNAASLRVHPNYNRWTTDSDVAIMRTSNNIGYNNNVRAGSIAGANYNLGDNQVVWAIGWGRTSQNGSPSEQLRHVQIWTINQGVCNQRYNGRITGNMLCSGWLNVGGRDQCQGDSGGPLLHNGVVVGVCSFGQGCALATHPGVNARVSVFSNWIRNNA